MYLDDIAIIALIPGIVEIAKRLGMPSRFAGLAAIGAATVLVTLDSLGAGVSPFAQPAQWIVLGVVYGLAASGLYSQVQRIATERPRRDVA
jgi:hypothetical protein